MMASEVQVTEVQVEPTTRSGAELNISALNPDADGDGNVSPLEMEIYKSLKAADIDGSGSIGTGELYKVISDLVGEKRKVKNLSKLVVGLLLIIVLALASIFVVSLLAGETIKESKIPDCSDPAVNDARCEPQGLTHVGSVESYSPTLWGLAAAPTNQLASLKDMAMYIDMTADPAEQGVVEATFKITGVYKSSATVATFFTAQGFKIKLDSSAQTGTIQMEGQTFPVVDKAPANGRLLVNNDPLILGTMTGRQLVEHQSRRRELQFGGEMGGMSGAFGGALLTSGTFTMMAAAGGFRRKLEEAATNEEARRKLQFGGTFGGALLNSGSFTMMAASGGF